MSHIVLDDEQAKIVAEADDQVEVRDRMGRRLGYVFQGFSREELAEAQQRADSDGPWHTTAVIQEALKRQESA